MKFLIDCGHTLSGQDTGAEGNGYREQELTREVGEKVIDKLRELGHTALNVTCNSCNSLGESLSYRVNAANNLSGDLFISIHFNAGGGRGTEVYTNKGEEFTEAKNVLNNVVSLGYVNRGIKDRSHLAVIRNTNMKAMLIECCFIDSQYMKGYNPESLANAIVSGLTGQVVKPTSNKPIVDNKQYRVITGVFNKTDAESFVNKLKTQGTTAYVVDTEILK